MRWIVLLALALSAPELPAAAPPGREDEVIFRLEMQGANVRSAGVGLSRRAVSVDLRKAKLNVRLMRDVVLLPGVVRVDLSNTKVTDAELAVLAGARTIQRLRLAGCERVTDKGIEHLGKFGNLQVLDLTGVGITNAGVAALVELPRLSSLNLSETPVTGEGLRHLSRMKALTELSLIGCDLLPSGLKNLLALPRLEILRLDVRLTGTEPQVIGSFTRLRELELHPLNGFVHSKLNPVTKHVVKHFGQLTELRRFTMWGLSDSDLGFLSSRLTKLEELDLWGDFTSVGLKQLKGLKKLRRLTIDTSEVIDDGLGALADLLELRELRLPTDVITDASLKHLAMLKKLEVLDLTGTKTTQKGRDALKKALPDLELRYAPR